MTDETSWDLPPDPEAVRKSRDMVRDALALWDLQPLTDEVLLVVGELCANAYRHGRPPISLTLHRTWGLLTGAVTDAGPSFTVPPPRPPADDAEDGRGLLIVHTLTNRWGIHPNPKGGKTIWFHRYL